MSFLNELCSKKKSLKSTDTIVTCADGRRYVEAKNNPTLAIQNADYGFIVDTAPDNVPAKVTDNLYLGSQDCCEGDVLKSHNISHVLSVGIEPIYKHDGVTYKFVECLDLPETDVTSLLMKECVPFLKLCIQQNSKVLVHCNAGVSRSSAIVIGFLMLERKVAYAEAFSIVKSARSCIKPNSGFQSQLSRLAQ